MAAALIILGLRGALDPVLRKLIVGNVVGAFYIRKCERKDGKLVNTVIKTYPDVSQFWTYDEKWFLSQPVYARDFPPAKNLEQ